MKDPRRTWRQGVVVGLIAYASVAIFYGIFDFLAARMPLYTVNLLGQSVFRGLRDPAVLQYAIQRDPGAIFLYNGLHLLVSLAIGLFVVRLIAMAEDDPRRAGPVLLVIVAGFVLTVLAVGLLTSGMRPASARVVDRGGEWAGDRHGRALSAANPARAPRELAGQGGESRPKPALTTA